MYYISHKGHFGNVAILVSLDCYHMAGQMCPGFAGLRVLPGVREIKI